MSETLDDGLLFDGYIQPPDVPPDPTGNDWRGPPGPAGPVGPVGPVGPGVPEAPADGVTYGRQNGTTWTGVLPLTGGTLTGPLLLAADPAVALGAATKQYVDGHAPLGGPYLPLAGGTLTGPTTMTGGFTISGAVDPNTTLYVTSTGSAWPAIKWNSVTQGTAAGYFESQRNGLSRWSVEFGTSETESTGNLGTNFNIRPFNDDGSAQQVVFRIARSSRVGFFGGAVTFGYNGVNTSTMNALTITPNAVATTATTFTTVGPVTHTTGLTTSNAGADFSVIAGSATTGSVGGKINLTGGAGAGTTSTGGSINLVGGTGNGTLISIGGAINLTSGSGAGGSSQSAGAITLTGASAPNGGGNITLTSGNVTATSSTGSPIILRLGSGTTTGGSLQINGTGSTNNLTVTPGATAAAAAVIASVGSGGLQINGIVGFNNTAPVAKPTVTGAKGSNAALASLLTALASYGLITDSSTA